MLPSPDIPSSGPTNPDDAARLSRERREREMGGNTYSADARGHALEETLRTTDNPFVPWDITLENLKGYANTEFVPEPERYYEMDALLKTLKERGRELGYSKNDLIIKGYLSIANGTPVFLEKGYELRRKPIQVERPVRVFRDEEGKVVTESELVQTEIPILGEDSERRESSKAFLQAYNLGQIHKLQISKHQHYAKNIENITGLAEEAYLGDHITEKGLELLFNTPGTVDTPKRTVMGVGYKEGREMGDMYFTTIFLYELVGSCEKKDEFLALRNTPGYFEFLFPDSRPDFVSEKERFWVGDANKWIDESHHTAHSYETEAKSGLRGVLTSHGNIFAHFDVRAYEETRNAVRVFLGGGKEKFFYGGKENEFNGGDKDPENKDVKFVEDFILKEYKYYGMASDNGVETYSTDPNENKLNLKDWAERVKGTPSEGKIVVSEMGADSSDDYVKMETGKFMRVYFQKGRDAGPAKLVFDLDIRFTTSLIRAIGFNMGFGKRSMRELMTGAYVWKEGKKINEVAEKPVKFGDLPWWTAGRRVLQSIGLTKFMGGRGGENPGVFHILQKENLRLESLTDEGWWLDLDKKVQLSAGNSAVVTRGEYRRYPQEEVVHNMQKQVSIDALTAVVRAIESYTQHATLDTNPAIGTGTYSHESQISLINHAIRRFNERTGYNIPAIKLETKTKPRELDTLLKE